MPGDPASNLCPDCPEERIESLRVERNLDAGPQQFYLDWMGSAFSGDLGYSWKNAGTTVNSLLFEQEGVSNTLMLLGLSGLFLCIGMLLSAMGRIPSWVKAVFRVIGTIPALVLGLGAFAFYTVNFDPNTNETTFVQILLGALSLALADAALSGSIDGTDEIVSTESRRRYVQIGVLRGEKPLWNILPNTFPSLVGQLRARLLNLVSASIIIELVFKINGVGGLLFEGAVDQDFGLVLGCTFVFVLISSVLLLLQAIAEIVTAMVVRSSPKGVVE